MTKSIIFCCDRLITVNVPFTLSAASSVSNFMMQTFFSARKSSDNTIFTDMYLHTERIIVDDFARGFVQAESSFK